MKLRILRLTFHKTAGLSVLAALALASATNAHAQDQSIHFVACGDEISPVHAKYIEQWESQNEGWTIDAEAVGWGQCQDKVTTLAVSGTPVGIAYVGSRTLKQFAENDLIVPIEFSDEEKAAYFPYIMETVTSNDQQWGLPVAFSTKSLYWNKDLFREAGLDPEKPPTTWAEQLEYAKQIAENTDAAGFGVVAKTFDNTMHQFLHWVYTNDGQVIDGENNITLDSPQNLEALTALKEIVPYAEEGPTAYEQLEVRAIFLDGKLGMTQQSVGAVKLLNEVDFEWGVAQLPLGPQAKGPGTLLITDSLAVFNGSGVEEKAVEFGRFLTNAENQPEYEKVDGLTPLRPGPAVDELIAEDSSWKPFIDGIDFGGPEPLFVDYKGLQDTMIEMVQAVVTDKEEPATALSKAAKDLEQYK